MAKNVHDQQGYSKDDNKHPYIPFSLKCCYLKKKRCRDVYSYLVFVVIFTNNIILCILDCDQNGIIVSISGRLATVRCLHSVNACRNPEIE